MPTASRPSRRSRLTIAAAALALLGSAPPASAALPDIGLKVTTTPLANFGSHRGVAVTATCAGGTRLVGGGGYLRNASSTTVLPTNGLVLGGTTASTGASPVDQAVADGATDPQSWLALANFTGVSEAGDQAATFALCATAGGPAHTIVKTATRTGANAAQEVAPPALATATCPAGTRLIGGGATTSTPDQINDGVTVGNNGNLKPMGDYPSDAAGVPAANGSSSANSWSAFGSAGITAATDSVTAYALCSIDPATPPVQVARADVTGPDAQAGTTTILATASCPGTTRMLGGGYRVLETVNGTSGLQPQQGYHMRGSYPSSAGGPPPPELADGTTNPSDWTAMVQAGGQNLSAGKTMTNSSFAMCATAPAPSPPAATTGSPGETTGSTAALTGTLNPAGSPTAYVFEYGTTLSFGSMTTPDGAGTGYDDVPIGATLSGLAAGTTYYYRLVATNAVGTTLGTVHSVTTMGAPTPPAAVTLDPASVTGTSATLAGTVNPRRQQTAYTFEYGTTTDFGSITPVVALDDANVPESVSATLTGLMPNTFYLYRIVATNATGTTAGAVKGFTTGPAT